MEDNSFLIKLCDSRITVIERMQEQFRSALDNPDEEVLPLCYVHYIFFYIKQELVVLIQANQKAVKVEISPERYAILKLQIAKMVGLIKEMDSLADELEPYLYCPAVDKE